MRMWTWIGRSPARAMPMAAPVIASSDSGVPKTRSAPYFSGRPSVVPWIAFGSSTSSPNRTTFGSRAISRSVASRIASTNERTRSPVFVVREAARSSRRQAANSSASSVKMSRHQFARVRERARLRELERGGRSRPPPPPRSAFARRAGVARPARGTGSFVYPRLALGLVAVAEVIVRARADVLAPAVRRHFEELRPFAARELRDRVERRVAQRRARRCRRAARPACRTRAAVRRCPGGPAASPARCGSRSRCSRTRTAPAVASAPRSSDVSANTPSSVAPSPKKHATTASDRRTFIA